MTRQELNTFKISEDIDLIINKIALATMAIDGWHANGEREEGVAGLGFLLDEAITDLRAIANILHPTPVRTERLEAVENAAA